jgi:hypothetical protein
MHASGMLASSAPTGTNSMAAWRYAVFADSLNDLAATVALPVSLL